MEFAYLAAGFGAALTVIGGAFGIGKLASSAMEASGRQPEAAGDIRTSMIIAAALIEGISLFALVICILLALK
ncbi:MAG: ATP synthase F0 subunit C [Ignavibacteriales bacterium]|jgi:F-type H+-transporting ATPase subunit c|nr:MAG: F0F1 ATP synthase subunit C [Stygiobacter sp.]KAF0210395.1 MAG: F0F1 ATP synthase subunit [Ignavibacteria bacterium]MBI3124182.1 ATP synthase F0 subunit C [Ignavibacteriales bacterium]OGU65075.1 MAG: ATP synthase F0 subunit C [Stygiobacter sp. GWC2_38_9]OGU84130.1 MAG: ATP synthase F0 subunit C [Stygiobacter sp. RIFOXYA12_FULL_38_9]OGV09079.1 MAG: ATP synthase F0 subunit C [Stygiobacter sp. RIFOXYB2_FULL_37_11]OGV14108.1 MAG: ATP synthase F0 subunit C [Stygiobacter sp. RIFOXYA2_FULL_3